MTLDEQNMAREFCRIARLKLHAAVDNVLDETLEEILADPGGRPEDGVVGTNPYLTEKQARALAERSVASPALPRKDL